MDQEEIKEKPKKKHRGLIITLSTIAGLVVIILVAFFGYASVYYKPTENCLTYLNDSSSSTVKEEKKYITFTPKNTDNIKDGIIFYPGGKVDYRSYAHLLRDLSDNGVASILVKMPFNLAVFNKNAANDKQKLIPSVTNWYISGHSLGGSMACSYLKKNYEQYKGIILLASYSTTDLSSTSLKTLSITASNDKVLNKDKYEANKDKLPNLTEYQIEGGIHSYFGDYGHQDGDGDATITVDEQTSQVVNQIVEFVK